MQTKLILRKYKPVIVAITGSVGKTSTKEAIFSAVSGKLATRKSEGNYNTDIGVPLSIMGAKSGERNLLRWAWIILKGLFIFLFPVSYPRLLILEMGSDRPGDIPYLVSFIKPWISVVSAVGPSHLEYFGELEKIAREKSALVSALPPDGVAILNYDDEIVRRFAVKHKGKVIFFGLDSKADVYPSELAQKSTGFFFKVNFAGSAAEVKLPGSVGKPNIYAALAAVAVGIALDVNLVDISKGLANFRGVPGRLRLLPGIKSTTIIDDTYNSAPASCIAALEVLAALPGTRKIAILGDMAELGYITEDAHREVGAVVVDQGVNLLITVGAKAKFIGEQAIHMNYPPDQILFFADSTEACLPIQNLLRPADVVLIKGSRAMHMEKIVKEIMAEPERARELLVS